MILNASETSACAKRQRKNSRVRWTTTTQALLSSSETPASSAGWESRLLLPSIRGGTTTSRLSETSRPSAERLGLVEESFRKRQSPRCSPTLREKAFGAVGP